MSASNPGHQENVDNLGIMIGKLSTMGGGYQPSNPAYTVYSLGLLKTESVATNDAVMAALLTNKNDVATRTFEFSDFDNLITRVANTIRISNAKQQSVDQAMSIIRDIRGERATQLATEQELAAAKEKGAEIVQNTKHNASIKSQTVNFGKLNLTLGTMPEYNPNEADLKLFALIGKQATMTQQNEAVDSSAATLEGLRVTRNRALYSPTTGLVSVAKSVKLYVKSAFGATSSEYKQISGIVFSYHN